MENKQVQSISDQEHFKVVVVAHSQQKAEEIAFWLTGAECVWRGNFYKAKSGNNFLAYCRWHNNPANLPTTIYADAMVIYLNSAEEFADLSDYILHRRGIVNKIIISESGDFSSQASTIKGRFLTKPSNPEELRSNLLRFDQEFMENARAIFNKFDTNNNGHISWEEVEKASTELGDTFSEKDLETIKSLSQVSQLGISFENFIIWWKLGRQNSFALMVLITLENLAAQAYKRGVELVEGVQGELSKLTSEEENISHHHVKFHSGNVGSGNHGTQLLFDFYLGKERYSACVNYLKQWTTNFNSANGVFLDFDFKFDETVDGKEAKRIIDEKVNFLKVILAAIEPVKNFLDTFCIIETYGNQNSGKLTIRLKVDAEGLLKKHMKNCFVFFDTIFQELSQHLELSVKTKTAPVDIFTKNLNGFQVLQDFEADLNIRMMRDHLRLIFSRFPSAAKQFGYVLTGPSNVDLNIKFDPIRAAGPKLKSILETPLGFLGELVKMVPLDMVFGADTVVIKKIKEIQVAVNTFFFFTHFKLGVEGIFDV